MSPQQYRRPSAPALTLSVPTLIRQKILIVKITLHNNINHPQELCPTSSPSGMGRD